MRKLRPTHRQAFAFRAVEERRQRQDEQRGALADQPSAVAHEVTAAVGGYACPCGWRGADPISHIFGR